MEAILSPFVKRFSQPIILSFIIAWIFWNWEIVIALLWYNQETMPKLNKEASNYIDYINSLNNPWKLYYGPVLSSFAYPFIVLIANNFNALIKRADNWLFIKISKGGNVSTELYLDAKDILDKKEKRISKFIDKEAEMESNINELTISKNELFASETALKNENIELNSSLTSLNFENTNLKIENEVTRKLSKLDWLVGEGLLELVDFDPQKTMTAIMSGNYTVIEKDDEYLLNIRNKSGSVGFIISKPMFNPVTMILQISIDNIGNQPENNTKNATEDILFFVIFRDLNEKILKFKVNDDRNTMVSKIASGRTKYELEMKTPTIK